MEEIKILQKDDEKFTIKQLLKYSNNNFSCIKQILLKKE